MLRLLSLATVVLTALAQNGPSSLYSLLNGQTFNPPGYTIVMYQSCVQNQNAGNPCGSFSGFQSSNGQYTHMLYGPEAPVSPTCSRTFKLALACGATVAMSGVNENPTCVYSATLTLPQVCGVNLMVGQEAASVSPTVAPAASMTSTQTITASMNASATSTPLYQVIYSAFPSTTSTQTLTATSTPLFMITAWPTTSPVNVSATSTPLYYYTAYPSVQGNTTEGGGLLGLAASLTGSSSSTSIIIGSVALGIVGIAAIGGGIAYMRNGGSVKGLMAKVEANKGAISQFTNALPISAEQKAKLQGAIADPSSLVPSQVNSILEKAEGFKEQALQAQQSVLQILPPSVAEAVLAKEAVIHKLVQEQVNQKLASVASFVPLPVESITAATVTAATAATTGPVAASVTATLEAVTAVPDLVQVAISPENIEAVKAFLAEKAEKEEKAEKATEA